MSLTGDEIRRLLAEFADRWQGYAGPERAEAEAGPGVPTSSIVVTGEAVITIPEPDITA